MESSRPMSHVEHASTLVSQYPNHPESEFSRLTQVSRLQRLPGCTHQSCPGEEAKQDKDKKFEEITDNTGVGGVWSFRVWIRRESGFIGSYGYTLVKKTFSVQSYKTWGSWRNTYVGLNCTNKQP
jgi:hypothetical protein